MLPTKVQILGLCFIGLTQCFDYQPAKYSAKLINFKCDKSDCKVGSQMFRVTFAFQCRRPNAFVSLIIFARTHDTLYLQFILHRGVGLHQQQRQRRTQITTYFCLLELRILLFTFESQFCKSCKDYECIACQLVSYQDFSQ